MKELLRTTDPTVIAFASALLQGEGINCFPIDVHMSVLEGSVGVLPRRVMVRDQDLLRAERILLDNDIDLGR
ncbi:MAG: putative signal transducing protein [Paracoccaceae bacterium]